MFGEIFKRLFSPPPPPLPKLHQPMPGHTVTLTPSAAEMIRRIVLQQGLRLPEVSVMVGGYGPTAFTLDLTEDPNVRQSMEFAVSVSEGLHVVIPRHQVNAWAGITINGEHGGFKFRGPGVIEFAASHPGGIPLSEAKLTALSREYVGDPDAIARLRYHLDEGTGSPAIVVSLAPLVVAARAGSLDAIALLQFPQHLANGLKLGDRLLTVSLYVHRGGQPVVNDLVEGPTSNGHFRNFIPIIADFLTDDLPLVRQRKDELVTHYWQQAADLIPDAMARARGRYRNGLPPHTEKPAY